MFICINLFNPILQFLQCSKGAPLEADGPTQQMTHKLTHPCTILISEINTNPLVTNTIRKGVYLYSTTPHKARTMNVKQKFPEINRINTLIINFNSKRLVSLSDRSVSLMFIHWIGITGKEVGAQYAWSIYQPNRALILEEYLL